MPAEAPPGAKAGGRTRLGKPRLLIVGCGDIGLELSHG